MSILEVSRTLTTDLDLSLGSEEEGWKLIMYGLLILFLSTLLKFMSGNTSYVYSTFSFGLASFLILSADTIDNVLWRRSSLFVAFML